jgi:hypothetical protein
MMKRFKQMLARLSPLDIALRLFITCWLIYTVHFATNVVREVYPAISLGEHLSFDVSEYAGLHPDIFEMPGRGTFINNNPGASMLGAVPYALARPVVNMATDRVLQKRAALPEPPEVEYDTQHANSKKFLQESMARGLDVKLGLAAAVTQAGVMGPLSALSAVVMFFVLLWLTGGNIQPSAGQKNLGESPPGPPAGSDMRLTGSKSKALALAGLYAFATPVFYRTAQLNHNLLASHFAFFAFVLLWSPWDKASRPKPSHYLWAGLLTGWTVVFDYSGIVVVLALSLYAFVRWQQTPTANRQFSSLLNFGLGIALAAIILMGYQWSSFGHPLYPAQHYMPATEFSGYGYSGFDWPDPTLLGLLAFGARYGLFTSAPILLLALYVPGWFGRARRVGRRELGFIVGFSATFFLFSAANKFGYVQFNTGVRHIVPVTPFLFLLAAGVFLQLPRPVAVLFGLLATYWMWTLAMYRDVEYDRGIYEAVIQITTGGPQLPWFTTLQNMGYVDGNGPVIVILLALTLVIAGLWLLPSFGFKFRGAGSKLKIQNSIHHS